MASELKIKSVIGFSGKVANSLKYTPDGKYIIYTLGSFVVLKNLKTDKEAFLEGHSQDISCLAMSHDGSKAASGQINLIGVKADVIVWNLIEARKQLDSGRVMIGDYCVIHRLKQHLTKVQDVAFSCDDSNLATLGGQDDNAVVVWRVTSGEALCGSPAGADSGLCVRWLNGRTDRFVTAGNYHVKVWQVDFSLPKLNAMDAKLGTARRIFTAFEIQNDDAFGYFGTTTGDILKIKLDRDEVKSYNDPDTVTPVMAGCSKDKIAKGIKTMWCLYNRGTGKTNIVVGGGDGSVIYLNSQLNVVAGYKTMLMGGITSIFLNPDGKKFLIGTDQCNRYEVSTDLQEAVLKQSCHFGAVNDVAFPDGSADVIVTTSRGDIRVWNLKSKQELLRIQVPNLDCSSCLVTPSGSAIITGWEDGKIRAFLPESGKMKFVIPEAHSEKVTALAIAGNDSRPPWRIISGGGEGRVRVWNCTNSHQAMLVSLKEHRGPVNSIKVNKDSSQCITASSDGSCIVWDLERYVRIIAFFEPNIFESVLYHPDESQMLTCGSNFKITYWDANDGQAIRVIEGGNGSMTTLDIDGDGEFFVSGSQDKVVKIWSYDEGLPVAIGRGHSGAVRSVKFSPDMKNVVSVGSAGEIIIWELPKYSVLRAALAGDHK